MARPRTYKTEALVLKGSPFGEADRLLTLYTLDRGKLRAVAKGVRRATSKLAGHLEPLTCSLLLLAEGRNLDVVAQAETKESFKALRDSLEALARAMYMAELVDAFAPEEVPNPGLYRLLLANLRWLSARAIALDESLEAALLRRFELRLLDLLGYRPELHRCVECSGPVTSAASFFNPRAGGVICVACRSRWSAGLLTVSPNALRLLRSLQSAEPRASPLITSASLREEVEGLLRHYIRYLLERDVHSIDFMDLLKREASPVEA
ncbi:MAG: DNA repair protein RecO [Chloroflexi bacterium]|nr:DNA repair protein RecO [Chloroflexota bacterium]